MTGEAEENTPAGSGEDTTPGSDADTRWSRRTRRTVAISQIVIAVAQAIDVVVKIFT